MSRRDAPSPFVWEAGAFTKAGFSGKSLRCIIRFGHQDTQIAPLPRRRSGCASCASPPSPLARGGQSPTTLTASHRRHDPEYGL